MAELSNDDLKREVEAVFGVTMTDEQIEAAKGRLPVMLDNARLLADWSQRLGTTCPAQIQKVIANDGSGAAGHG